MRRRAFWRELKWVRLTYIYFILLEFTHTKKIFIKIVINAATNWWKMWTSSRKALKIIFYVKSLNKITKNLLKSVNCRSIIKYCLKMTSPRWNKIIIKKFLQQFHFKWKNRRLSSQKTGNDWDNETHAEWRNNALLFHNNKQQHFHVCWQEGN